MATEKMTPKPEQLGERKEAKKAFFFDAQPSEGTLKDYWKAGKAIAWCYNVESGVVTLWYTPFWGHDRPEASTEHRNHDHEVERDGGYYGYATKGSVIRTSIFDNAKGDCESTLESKVTGAIRRLLGPYDAMESARLRMQNDYGYDQRRDEDY